MANMQVDRTRTQCIDSDIEQHVADRWQRFTGWPHQTRPMEGKVEHAAANRSASAAHMRLG